MVSRETLEGIAGKLLRTMDDVGDVLLEMGLDTSEALAIEQALYDELGVEACALCGYWYDDGELVPNEDGANICYDCETQHGVDYDD